MLLAPILARVAFLFGPAEYFALYLLAFCTLGGIGSNNQAKAAISVCIGLGIAMIGVDNSTGLTRFTGGNMHLFDGIDFPSHTKSGNFVPDAALLSQSSLEESQSH